MTTKKVYKKYKDFEGFENLDKSKNPFEQLLGLGSFYWYKKTEA